MANERGLLPVCLYYKHIIATPSPQFSMSKPRSPVQQPNGISCNDRMFIANSWLCRIQCCPVLLHISITSPGSRDLQVVRVLTR